MSKRRLEKLRSIDPVLDFGDGMSLASFVTAINQLDGLQAVYNQSLSNLDGQLSIIKDTERGLQEMRERFLKLVGGKYGMDSTEYVNAGGVKKSERIWRMSKAMKKTPKES